MAESPIIIPVQFDPSKGVSSLAPAQAGINRLSQSSKTLSDSLNRTTGSGNSATFALTNLGRVAQDLPFGFIGIANNITPLIESLTSLNKQAKQTGSTLGKELLNAIKGGGGLIFGFSILSTALSFATVGLSAFTRGFGNTKTETEKAKEEIFQFGKVLDETAADLSKSAARVNQLFVALNSGKLNLSERKAALKELSEINKEFFGSLREENGLIVGLQAAYDGYLQKLKDVGRAKAVQSQLTKLFDKKLQLELSVDSKFLANIDPDVARQIGQAKKNLQSLGGAVDLTKEKFDPYNDTQAKRLKLQEQIRQLEEGETRKFVGGGIPAQIKKQIEQIDLQINALSGILSQTGEFGIKIDNKEATDEMDKTIARAKQFVQEFGDTFIVPDLEESFTNTKDKIFQAAKKLLDDIEKNKLVLRITPLVRFDETVPLETDFFNELRKKKDKDFLNQGLRGNLGQQSKIIKGIVPGVDDDVAKRNKEFFAQFHQDIRATADLVSSALTPAFTGMFDAIINGGDPLKSFFDGIVDSINQIIDRLIAAAVQAAVLSALSGGTSSFGTLFGKFLGFSGGAANRGLGAIPIHVQVSGNLSSEGIHIANVRGQQRIGRAGGF